MQEKGNKINNWRIIIQMSTGTRRNSKKKKICFDDNLKSNYSLISRCTNNFEEAHFNYLKTDIVQLPISKNLFSMGGGVIFSLHYLMEKHFLTNCGPVGFEGRIRLEADKMFRRTCILCMVERVLCCKLTSQPLIL